MCHIALVVFLCCALPLAALAIPTGLNIMPTADVLESGQSRLEFESSGSGKLYVPRDSTVIGSQSGMLFGFEGGIDQVSDRGAVYNLKWRILPETVLPALAVGVQGVGEGGGAQYYAVATRGVGPARVSAGALKTTGGDGDTLLMVGARLDGGPFALKVDHVNGDAIQRTAGSVGLTLANVSVQATAYDLEREPTHLTVMVSVGHRL